MLDNHSKLIPALVHKNIENDFEIDIYNFDRNVKVNTFRPSLRENLCERIIYETKQKFAHGDDVGTFISSVYIQPSLKITDHSLEIEIRSQPRKNFRFKSGVTISRRFVIQHQPFVQICDEPIHESNDENNNSGVGETNPIVWETVVNIEV